MATPLTWAVTSGLCGAGIGYFIAQLSRRSGRRRRNSSLNGQSRDGHANGYTSRFNVMSPVPMGRPIYESSSTEWEPQLDPLPLVRQRTPEVRRCRTNSENGNILVNGEMVCAVPVGERSKVYGLGGYSQHNRVMLCMVGLPARGKSYIVKMLKRYLQWQGFPVKDFNAGDLRRERGLAGASADFFANEGSAQSAREGLATACMEEAFSWISQQRNACVAIFDATNTTKKRRQIIVQKCAAEGRGGITPVFIESICDDPEILKQNYKMKLDNDDYKNMDPVQARADFLERVKQYEARYETVEDHECGGDIRYVKVINVGQKVVMHQCSGYVVSNVGFYLSNIHIRPRRIWLMRHAETEEQISGRLGSVSDELTDRGARYCCEVAKFVHAATEKMKLAGDNESAEVLVLTGTAPVHSATSEALHVCRPADGVCGKRAAETVGRFPVMTTSLLNELDGGDCNGMSYEQIRKEFPDIWTERDRDKLNFRYPGAGGESYVDVIHRLGPIILELERQQHSVLVISHLAVQRCIFGYFDNTDMQKIPYLDLEMHTLYELCPGPFGTKVNRIELY